MLEFLQVVILQVVVSRVVGSRVTRTYKPAEIVDRDAEWRRLGRVRESSRPELVLVLGRRRVGKSWILSRFSRAAGGLYYQATRRTEREQLRNLSRQVGEHFADDALRHGIAFPDWEELFGYLLRRAGGDPLLVVLDEFPFLVSAAPALPSIVQKIWDHEVEGSRLKLILGGSYVTAMNQLEAGDQPLYGRRTARILVRPFPYREMSHFAPDYGPQDRLRAYGIFGGLPGNLALLDPALGVGENAAEQVLDPSSRLFDEANHVLDAFLADGSLHYSIIDAIANGNRKWSNITSWVGTTAGSVSRPMGWLIDMQFVERVVPITENSPARSKRAIYRIEDPYLAFWHRFVAPLIRDGSAELASPAELWWSMVQPKMDDYMGAIFEAACRDYVSHARSLPFKPVRVGQWWDANAENEIDIVALGSEGEMLVAECKWGTVDRHDVTVLLDRVEFLRREVSGVRKVYLAFFAGRESISDRTRAELARHDVLFHTAGDLFG